MCQIRLVAHKNTQHKWNYVYEASESLSYSNTNLLGSLGIGYSRSRKEVNSILEKGSESLSIDFGSKPFLNYSTIGFSGKFDLVEDDPTNYKFRYIKSFW